jgi:hypothetical protein
VAKKRWIQSAVKHPGVEKKRAQEHGISTHEQLERDSHSSDPTLRGRGNLGLRFEKGGDLHRGKSEKPKHTLRDLYKTKKKG